MSKRLLAIAATALLLAEGTAAADGQTIEKVLEDLNLPADAAARIRRGEMVHSGPRESSEREMAVGLTFLIQQPLPEVVKAFRAGTDLKADRQVTASGLIVSGTLADFAGLEVEPDGAREARRYLAAHAGDELNLSPDEIAAFNGLAAGGDPKPQVEEQLKASLLARYQAYRAKGLAGMGTYARSGHLCEPSGELRRMSEAARLLKLHAPAMQQILLTYPEQRPAGLEERFYWLRYELDGRPNYALDHRLALQVGDTFATADRAFYVSHGYNVSQSFAGLIPVPEGTLVVYRSRVSTDQVAGFGSSAKKGIGRGMLADHLTAIFERSRASFGKNGSAGTAPGERRSEQE
jgi:hypothetical protein